jgi:hypothetical protein
MAVQVMNWMETRQIPMAHVNTIKLFTSSFELRRECIVPCRHIVLLRFFESMR